MSIVDQESHFEKIFLLHQKMFGDQHRDSKEILSQPFLSRK
jgi:hypothetical protein